MKRLSNRNDATVQTGTASEAFINVQRRGLSAEMIMSKEEMESAFPTSEENYEKVWSSPGLTLRDYFAAKAVAAIVRRYDGHSFGGGPDSPQYRELAVDAYYIADAMLLARDAP